MRAVYVIFLMLFLFQKGYSQDLIVKKNGEEIQSKVLEVLLNEVKYKRFNNLDGPTFTILKKEIFMIKYENGTKDVFNDEKKEEEKKAEQSKGNENVTVTYKKITYQQDPIDRGINNAIKVNPLLIFDGDIPIYFERRITDRLTAEVGLGITHKDYFYELSKIDEEWESQERTFNVGYSIRANGRYYPSRNTLAFEELYFGGEIRLQHYKSELTGCGDNKIISPPFKEKRSVLDLKLIGGYYFYVSDVVFIDLYAGIGLRNNIIEEGVCAPSGPVTIKITPSTSQEWVPAISLGAKLGFGLK